MKQFKTHIRERTLPESLDKDIERIILKMRETGHNKLFLATSICYYTGIRISECSSLHWSDIDFEKKHLNIRRRAWNLPGTKGSTAKRLKSRLVPMPLELAVILHDENPNDWFIKNDKTDKHIRKETLERELQKWLKNNWPYTFKFHDLRHLYTTLRIKEGVPVMLVSKILGHKDLATTSIYAHYDIGEYNFFAEMENEEKEDRTTRRKYRRTRASKKPLRKPASK